MIKVLCCFDLVLNRLLVLRYMLRKRVNNQQLFSLEAKVVCFKNFMSIYSSVPNRRAVRNKRAGGKFLKKTLNVQYRIDVQGGIFSQNQ